MDQAEAEAEKSTIYRRARTAEVILSLIIVCLLTGLFMLYFKLYQKESVDQQVQDEVNAQVSQYFQLAASE